MDSGFKTMCGSLLKWSITSELRSTRSEFGRCPALHFCFETDFSWVFPLLGHDSNGPHTDHCLIQISVDVALPQSKLGGPQKI